MNRPNSSELKRFSLVVAAGALLLTSGRPVSAQANWRQVQNLSFGRVRAMVEVSSARTVRLTSAIDNARLVSADFPPDTLRDWRDRVFNEMNNPKSAQYVLGNSILVQPFAADSAHIGYLVTLADTAGDSRQAILDKGSLEEFLDLLQAGVVAARVLSDADLRKIGAVVATPVGLAKTYKAVYPRTARLVGLSGKALVQFVVDTTGKAKTGTITTIDATYKDFGDAAASYVVEMEFTPATMDGHKIEHLVQYPFEFKLQTVLPITPFSVPVRRGR